MGCCCTVLEPSEPLARGDPWFGEVLGCLVGVGHVGGGRKGMQSVHHGCRVSVTGARQGVA